jgi:hypothetical protein
MKGTSMEMRNRRKVQDSSVHALRRLAPIGGASLVLKEGGVFLDEGLFVLGDVVYGVDRIRGADRDAGAAVDTLHRIDKELSRRFEAGFILLGMDAVGGANIDAEGILDAGIGDYIGHDEDLRDLSSALWFRSIFSVGAKRR